MTDEPDPVVLVDLQALYDQLPATQPVQPGNLAPCKCAVTCCR